MMMMTAMTIVFDERCEKKFGIEHSRTDMTDSWNNQVKETCNEIYNSYSFRWNEWDDK